MKKRFNPESFGYPDIDINGIQESDDFRCPECGNWTPDESYEVDGETYPIYCNETYTDTDMGISHDWDEIHVCNKCGKKFYFTNGCY